jgi:hypothetical protein
VAQGLQRSIVGDGAISRHAPGGDVDKNHYLRLELGRDRRVCMAQSLGHVVENATVAVHGPVRERQRAYPDQTSAAEDF